MGDLTALEAFIEQPNVLLLTVRNNFSDMYSTMQQSLGQDCGERWESGTGDGEQCVVG